MKGFVISLVVLYALVHVMCIAGTYIRGALHACKVTMLRKLDDRHFLGNVHSILADLKTVGPWIGALLGIREGTLAATLLSASFTVAFYVVCLTMSNAVSRRIEALTAMHRRSDWRD